MSIYSDSTRELLKRFVAARQSNHSITSREIFEWFRTHWPKISSGTIRATLTALTTNLPSRIHHPVRPGRSHDILFRLGRGQYRPYNPASDPTPFYRNGTRSAARPSRRSVPNLSTVVNLERILEDLQPAFEMSLQRLISPTLTVTRGGPKEEFQKQPWIAARGSALRGGAELMLCIDNVFFQDNRARVRAAIWARDRAALVEVLPWVFKANFEVVSAPGDISKSGKLKSSGLRKLKRRDGPFIEDWSAARKAEGEGVYFARYLQGDPMDPEQHLSITQQACSFIVRAIRAKRADDFTSADELQTDTVVRLARVIGTGQGLRLSFAERVAIEMRAMLMAKEWLVAQGYTCIDKSRTSPFDYEASNGELIYKVEVKGTSMSGSDTIFMTRNEVDLHIVEQGKTGLIIISEIELGMVDGEPVAKGGKVEAELGWDISSWDRVPITFRLAKNTSSRA